MPSLRPPVLMDYRQLEDTELIARVAGRDRRAFEQLYDRHVSKALGLALRVLQEQASAEEVVQEAFWRVWKRATTFNRERGNFTTWLFGIVHNLAIDRLRQQRGTPPVLDLDSGAEPAWELPDLVQNVADQAWARLQQSEMRAALAQLPEAQRMVIEMAYFEGLSRQEIAERLDEPLGTIHTRARLGLLKLKELLASLKDRDL